MATTFTDIFPLTTKAFFSIPWGLTASLSALLCLTDIGLLLYHVFSPPQTTTALIDYNLNPSQVHKHKGLKVVLALCLLAHWVDTKLHYAAHTNTPLDPYFIWVAHVLRAVFSIVSPHVVNSMNTYKDIQGKEVRLTYPFGLVSFYIQGANYALACFFLPLVMFEALWYVLRELWWLVSKVLLGNI
jgi:hypothetical protein